MNKKEKENAARLTRENMSTEMIDLSPFRRRSLEGEVWRWRWLTIMFCILAIIECAMIGGMLIGRGQISERRLHLILDPPPRWNGVPLVR